MHDIKKKQNQEDSEPEEEHFEIDFERIFLISRVELGLTQYQAETMQYGKWADIHHAYRELHNFKTKGGLYPDIEKEIKQFQVEHQPVASLLSL
ncbi:MAG: hypothetical protein J6Y57_01135 [Lachnospiraceae bacterium]|nr:hypothetical protein [Lachnospiraceae bacterium]